MGLFSLFGIFKKKKPSKKNGFGERMDRLCKGDLPFGWSYANRDFIGRIEKECSQFTDAYYSSRRKGIKQEYAALKSLIRYTEDVTRLCRRKGRCYAYWASRTVAPPKLIADYKARLKRLEEKLKTTKK